MSQNGVGVNQSLDFRVLCWSEYLLLPHQTGTIRVLDHSEWVIIGHLQNYLSSTWSLPTGCFACGRVESVSYWLLIYWSGFLLNWGLHRVIFIYLKELLLRSQRLINECHLLYNIMWLNIIKLVRLLLLACLIYSSFARDPPSEHQETSSEIKLISQFSKTMCTPESL